MAKIFENVIIMAILLTGLVTALAIIVFIANNALRFVRERRAK